MAELTYQFQPHHLIPILGIVGPLLTLLVTFALFIWRGVRKADIAARLKQDMLDRGMSAEEIRTVLDAGQ